MVWLCYELNDRDRMEIDHVFASGAMVERTTMHSWGRLSLPAPLLMQKRYPFQCQTRLKISAQMPCLKTVSNSNISSKRFEIHLWFLCIFSTVYTSRMSKHLPPGQNGCHFADDLFKCIFVKENFLILMKLSLMLVPMGPINNNQASPNKRQATIWTNVNPIHWRIYAGGGGGGDEF